MRNLSYLITAILIVAWLVGFFAYGSAGVIHISQATFNFDLKWVARIFRNAIRTVAFCFFLLLLQSCGHYVAEVPVAPVEVVGVAPFAGAVWIGGEWIWRGGHHTWVGGHWDHPRAGRTWQAGEWRHTPRGHQWVGGRWR